MSVISRYRRTEDMVAASLGDERAAAALLRAGISTHKLTPLSMSAGGNRGAKNPSTALVGSNRYGANGVDVGLHQDQFKHYSGHPYAIVRTIANRIAGQPIHHARKLRPGQSPQKSAKMAARCVNKDLAPAWVKSMPHELQEYAESPIVEMFANPNPVMVQHTLAYNTVASLEITAKAFWWLRYEDGDDDGDGIGGEPQGWYLPPQWMEAIHTADKLFAAWRVRPNNGGEPFILAAEEVVYYYYADPANPLEAYSPFEALAQPIMASESISESKRRNFLNSMAPSFAVVVGQSAEATGVGAALPQPVMTRSQRKALKSVLLEEYRGTLASGLPFVLDGFVRDIKPIYQTPRELDFLNSSQVTTQELNMGFGVNGISMGQVEGANRASSATADDHLCHDADTECLTRAGWVRYQQLTTDTEVACYHRDTGAITYEKPIAVHVYDHDGDMHRWSGECLDALMTPSHRCWVQTWEKPGEKPRAWGFRAAADLAKTTYYRIKQSGVAVADEPTGRIAFGSACELDPEAFCDLVGWFVSEGHHTTKPAGIAVSQSRSSKHAATVDALFAAIGLDFTKTYSASSDENQWIIWDSRSPGLSAMMLRECGHYSHQKKIPDFVKGWPARLLTRILDAACDGDAHVKSDVTRSYATTSRQLADDIQEIAVKCGWRASITPRKDDRPDRLPGWVVNLHKTDWRTLAGNNRSVEKYTGKVWCVSVPTELFIVRRGGGAAHVSGNCNNVINPRLSLMSQVATRCLPRYFTKRNDEVVYWEPAKSRDVEFEHKQRMDAYGCGVINRDEWRSALGMGPVDDGTKVLVSGAGISWVDVVPVDSSGAAGKSSAPKPPARPGGFKLPTGSLAASLGTKAVALSHDKIHRLYECRIRDAAAEVLRGLAGEFRERVAGLCAGGGAEFTPMHVTAALERHHWERSIGEVLTPLLVEAGLAAAAHEWMLAQNRAMATKAFLPAGLRRAVEKAIAAMIGNGVWRRLVDAIMGRARTAVERANTTNQNPAAAAVDAVASEEAIADRAAEIGLEEAQNAVGVGQKETFATLKIYNKAGGRQWYTMKDSRVRDSHQRAHGQVVRGDQKFVVGGHPCDYPGDRSLPPEERCGCRCVVLTVE